MACGRAGYASLGGDIAVRGDASAPSCHLSQKNLLFFTQFQIFYVLLYPFYDSSAEWAMNYNCKSKKEWRLCSSTLVGLMADFLSAGWMEWALGVVMLCISAIVVFVAQRILPWPELSVAKILC